MSSQSSRDDIETRDGEILADLFDDLLQQILEGKTPDLATYLPDRPDLKERIAKTWSLACSVAGRREPSRPVLGGYEILRELGHGGMGTVYLAQHQILQRECAIKVLPHSLAMSPRAKQRFLEEAKALARIRHDGVVHIHRILDHAEMLAFEMEFIEGKSLQQLVTDLRELPQPVSAAALASCVGVQEAALGTRNPVEWFVRTIVRVARALAEVHRHGLIHRDVKPSNVLLRADGTPVLADFGLARISDLDASQTGAFAGTPVYAAPERLRGGDTTVDARTDVYSLGVTLYELLTLQAPFAGSSTHEVLRRIENGALPSLRRRAPHVSRDLEVVVHKAMETDPRHRYMSADAFADDLERLLRFEPIHAHPAGPVRRLVQFVRRNHRTAMAGVIGATLVAIAAWPFAVHAGTLERRRIAAAEQLLTARTQLLSPECLQVAWRRAFADTTLQPLQEQAATAHRDALERVRSEYEKVLAIDPEQMDARREQAAVAGAIRALTPSAGQVPPDGDAFTAGLCAFLLGDAAALHANWDTLDRERLPFLSACMALQHTADGHAAQAYPQLYHATRSFPAATALPLAMADAAFAMGNRELAVEWLGKVPPPAEENSTSARVQLLRADLETDDDARETLYRQLFRRDPTDPVPVHHLAQHFLAHGAPAKAQPLLEFVLKLRPNYIQARRDLAWVSLQRRDLAGYIRQLRLATAIDRGRLPPAAVQAVEDITGMAGLTLDSVPKSAGAHTRVLSLGLWLPPHVVRNVGRAADLLLTLDRAARLATAADPRPLAADLLTAWYACYRLPQIGVHPPGWSLIAGLCVPQVLLGAPIDLATMATMPFQKILGEQATLVRFPTLVQTHPEPSDLQYAACCEAAGDIDGDTRPDLCVVSTAGAGSKTKARIEIRDLVDGRPLQVIQEDRSGTDFARGFAVLGDVDGDVCDDLLVGSPARGDGGAGIVELLSGRTGRQIWSHEGRASFGTSVATVADRDGDGIRDVLVGSPAPATDENSPRAFVLSGRTGGVLAELLVQRPTAGVGHCVADVGDIDADGTPDYGIAGHMPGNACLAVVLSGRDGRELSRFADADKTTGFGNAILGIGDADHDGHADLAITAPCYENRKFQSGRIDLLSGATGKLLRVIQGERTGDCFGCAVRTADWWRERGRPAIAVTALRGGPAGAGYVRVYDLQKGYPIQTLAANPSVRILAPSMANLGDVDADGFTDFAMPLLLRNGNCLIWRVSYAPLAKH